MPIEIDEKTDYSGLKMLTSFFAGIILAGGAAFFAYPKDLPTKVDMAQMQVQTQKQLDAFQAQQSEEQDEITSLRIDVGKIGMKLKIDENNH